MQSSPSPYQALIAQIHQGTNVFISGVGGCGKTYLLKQLYQSLSSTYKCVLTSTTGISAYNLGGITIHSFFRIILPQHNEQMNVQEWADNLVRRLRKRSNVVKRIKELQLLFLDEVSMLGANYLDLLNYVCQQLRGSTDQMGGIQCIFGGDMMQLAPVKDDYPFESETWKLLKLKYFCLTKAWRFDNQRWVDILFHARLGKLSAEDIELLESRLVSRTDTNPTASPRIPPIILSSRNDVVDRINRDRLDEISGVTEIFQAYDFVGSKDELDNVGDLKKAVFDQDVHNQFMADTMLAIKVGCQVMLIANLDVSQGLTNGTLGIVRAIKQNHNFNLTTTATLYPQRTIDVEFESGIHSVEYHQFVVDYKDTSYVRVAIPLKLAFATSIHKSQSLTLSSVEIDIGSNVFTEGQSYVALSRCKSLEGLYIRSLDVGKIRPNSKALRFEEMFLKKCVKL